MLFPIFNPAQTEYSVFNITLFIIYILTNYIFTTSILIITIIKALNYKKQNYYINNILYRSLYFIFIITSSFIVLSNIFYWFTASFYNPYLTNYFVKNFLYLYIIKWFIITVAIYLLSIYLASWKKYINYKKHIHHILIGFSSGFLFLVNVAITLIIQTIVTAPQLWIENNSIFTVITSPYYIFFLLGYVSIIFATASLIIISLNIFFAKKKQYNISLYISRIIANYSLVFIVCTIIFTYIYYQLLTSDSLDNLFHNIIENNKIVKAKFIILSIVIAIIMIEFILIKPKLIPFYLPIIPICLMIICLIYYKQITDSKYNQYTIYNYIYNNYYSAQANIITQNQKKELRYLYSLSAEEMQYISNQNSKEILLQGKNILLYLNQHYRTILNNFNLILKNNDETQAYADDKLAILLKNDIHNLHKQYPADLKLKMTKEEIKSVIKYVMFLQNNNINIKYPTLFM